MEEADNASASLSLSPPERAEGDDAAALAVAQRPKPKVPRARTACHQCRFAKSRCGGTPPRTCPNCESMGRRCTWPEEDGRSTRARLMRMRSAAQAAGRSSSSASAFASTSTAGMVQETTGMDVPVGAGGAGDPGWLDGILGRGGRSNAAGPTSAPRSLAEFITRQQQKLPTLGTKAQIPVVPRFINDFPSSWRPDTSVSPEQHLKSQTPIPNSEPVAGPSRYPAQAAPPSQPPQPAGVNPAFQPQSFPLEGNQMIQPFPVDTQHIFPPISDPSTVSFDLDTTDSFSPFASMDPTELIMALSSQLPTIEEGMSFDDRSPGGSSNQSHAAQRLADGTSPDASAGKARKDKEGKIFKVTWWRPHGKTAIAPGLKRITLKVRVDNPQATWRPNAPDPRLGTIIPVEEVLAADGMPTTPIMRHLLDVFITHFGCQFPFVDRQDLEAKIDARTGSIFLLNSIAAMAARFSTHPAIALSNLQPFEYGNVFYNRAKALLGSMFAVPQRETVFAFVLLANVGFANDSECEIWMMTGLAVRMSLDLALHLDPGPDSNISAEECRLNRLVFWSVLLMDHAISHGAGRRASFPLEDISQLPPTEEDIHPVGTAPDTPRSPFPYAAKQMLLYGPIINMLNRQSKGPATSETDLQAARATAMKEYNQLPPDMQWNIANLQRHSRAHQGSIFVHLHLWMHNILATAYLTGTDLYRRKSGNGDGLRSGAATPATSAAASNLWRNSARTIGDILVLSDITNPYSYFALPFVNQAFFVAGCCYIKEIEQHQNKTSPSPSRPTSPRVPDASLIMTSNEDVSRQERDMKHADFSRALLQSVAAANISTLQQGLAKQTVYWSGVAWVSAALAQRIEGVQDVDLVQVTEKLASFVSLPDAGLIGKSSGGAAGGISGQGQGLDQGLGPGQGFGREQERTGMTPGVSGWTPSAVVNPTPPGLEGSTWSGDIPMVGDSFDWSSFELGGIEGENQSVIEQDVVLPQGFNWDWFR